MAGLRSFRGIPKGSRERVGRLALVTIGLGLFSALACNFPLASRNAPPISEEARLLTLAAQLFPTRPESTLAPPGSSLVEPPFLGLQTATPGSPLPAATALLNQDAPVFQYYAQSGDTLAAVAARFGIVPEQIASPDPMAETALLPPGQLLIIPNYLAEEVRYPAALLPDSEIIYSPSAADFNTADFVAGAGGYLSSYQETVGEEQLSGAEIIQRIALDSSTNPRLLLALLEYRSGWVFSQPTGPVAETYPIGFYVPEYQGLYKELSLAVRQLSIGYYGWRSGALSRLEFADRSTARISPSLNAGSVAMQALFSKLYGQEAWLDALYGPQGFSWLYQQMFGDPWARAAMVEPLFPSGLLPPQLELPFLPGQLWSFTGGPHIAWGVGSPRGALDFAPVTGEPKCAVSRVWVTAAAPGRVVRSERSIVILDLDGDGYEQTGWVLMMMHLADWERIPAGGQVSQDDLLGHPSCEGGTTTGTHVHIARKYNGEWIAADGPLPFILSGWRVAAGDKPYEGFLVKGEHVVTARPDGSRSSSITR